jgi:hypothetical protein
VLVLAVEESPPASVGLSPSCLREAERKRPVVCGVGDDRGRGSTTWYVKDSVGAETTPTACHIGRDGVPVGANFLFEDDHVDWRRFNLTDSRDTIDLGDTVSPWLFFYKIPIAQH